MKVQKILFPTDFSESANAALGRALFLAKRLEADLHLLHAVILHQYDPNNPDQVFPGADEIFRELFAIADSNLAGLLEQHGDVLKLQEVTRRGVSAPEVILSYAEEMAADLIVMGTHGRTGAARLFMGSVAESVTRRARCPVLTVRGDSRSVREEKVRSILVPVDFSETSKLAIEYAKQLGHLYHAGLEVLHVNAEFASPYFYLPPESKLKQKSLARKALAKLAADFIGSEINYTISVRSGRVATEILDHARDSEAGLLVIGTKGLSGLERVLVGSTAEQVIREAPCPVFVVKSRA